MSTVQTTYSIEDDLIFAISSSKPTAVPYFIFNGSSMVQDYPVVTVNINKNNPDGHCYLTGSLAAWDVYNVGVEYNVLSQTTITPYASHSVMVNELNNVVNDVVNLNNYMVSHSVMDIEDTSTVHSANSENGEDITTINHNLKILIKPNNFVVV